MSELEISLAVIMQHRVLQNRWQSEVWEPHGVVLNHASGGEPRLLVEEGGTTQWLHPGFALKLFRDEIEGYYLNVSSKEPRVFIMWRMEERMESPFAVPQVVTLSYNEAGRLMDGGEKVDTVAMPAELLAWVGEHVERNYRPETKKRSRPQSFMHPKDRVHKASH